MKCTSPERGILSPILRGLNDSANWNSHTKRKDPAPLAEGTGWYVFNICQQALRRKDLILSPSIHHPAGLRWVPQTSGS